MITLIYNIHILTGHCKIYKELWADSNIKIRAITRDNIIYNFIYTKEIAKKLGVSTTTINQIWKGSIRKSRQGITKSQPKILEIIEENF